jgi:hypothetical protein
LQSHVNLFALCYKITMAGRGYELEHVKVRGNEEVPS